MEENEVVMEGENGGKKSGSKKIIVGVVAVIVVIAVIFGIITIVKPSPEKTVKSFIKDLNNKKMSKVFDKIDMAGMTAFEECDGDYEDFVDNYKDAKEEMEDEDDVEEYMDEIVEDAQDSLDDLDTFKVEIKKIKSAKKVKDAKNLYKVNAKVKTEVKKDDDDKTERDTSTIDFYVYKVKGKFYIVGMDTKSGNGLDLF